MLRMRAVVMGVVNVYSANHNDASTLMACLIFFKYRDECKICVIFWNIVFEAMTGTANPKFPIIGYSLGSFDPLKKTLTRQLNKIYLPSACSEATHKICLARESKKKLSRRLQK